MYLNFWISDPSQNSKDSFPFPLNHLGTSASFCFHSSNRNWMTKSTFLFNPVALACFYHTHYQTWDVSLSVVTLNRKCIGSHHLKSFPNVATHSLHFNIFFSEGKGRGWVYLCDSFLLRMKCLILKSLPRLDNSGTPFMAKLSLVLSNLVHLFTICINETNYLLMLHSNGHRTVSRKRRSFHSFYGSKSKSATNALLKHKRHNHPRTPSGVNRGTYVLLPMCDQGSAVCARSGMSTHLYLVRTRQRVRCGLQRWWSPGSPPVLGHTTCTSENSRRAAANSYKKHICLFHTWWSSWIDT